MQIGEEAYCSCCGKVLPLSKFFKRSNKKNEIYPLCKNCYAQKFGDYRDKSGNEEVAAWCVLAEMGIPYYKEIWANVRQNVKTGQITAWLSAYLRLVKDFEKPLDGFWQSDTPLEELIELKADIEEPEEQSEEYRKLQESLWGAKSDGGEFSSEDYEFLNNLYNDYTKEIVSIDTAQSMRYRDLCKAELRKHRGDASKETTEEILKLMKLLKIDNFEVAAEKSDALIAYEKVIAMVEYSKPAEYEDLQKYIDLCGYEKDRAEDMRNLKNAIAGTRDYPDIPIDER